MKNNPIIYIMLCLLIFSSFTAGVSLASRSSTYALGVETKQLIAECEKELKRTQHCVLSVIPEDE